MAIKLIKVGHGFNTPVKTYVVDPPASGQTVDDVLELISNPHFGDKAIIPNNGIYIYGSDDWNEFAEGVGGSSGGADLVINSGDEGKILTAKKITDEATGEVSYTYEWTALPDFDKFDDIVEVESISVLQNMTTTERDSSKIYVVRGDNSALYRWVGDTLVVIDEDLRSDFELYTATNDQAISDIESDITDLERFQNDYESFVAEGGSGQIFSKITELESGWQSLKTINETSLFGEGDLSLQTLIDSDHKLSYDLISGTPNLETKQDLINESNKLDYNLLDGAPAIDGTPSESNKVLTQTSLNGYALRSEIDDDYNNLVNKPIVLNTSNGNQEVQTPFTELTTLTESNFAPSSNQYYSKDVVPINFQTSDIYSGSSKLFTINCNIGDYIIVGARRSSPNFTVNAVCESGEMTSIVNGYNDGYCWYKIATSETEFITISGTQSGWSFEAYVIVLSGVSNLEFKGQGQIQNGMITNYSEKSTLTLLWGPKYIEALNNTSFDGTYEINGLNQKVGLKCVYDISGVNKISSKSTSYWNSGDGNTYYTYFASITFDSTNGFDAISTVSSTYETVASDAEFSSSKKYYTQGIVSYNGSEIATKSDLNTAVLSAIELPETGANGDVLTLSDDGPVWATPQSSSSGTTELTEEEVLEILQDSELSQIVGITSEGESYAISDDDGIILDFLN